VVDVADLVYDVGSVVVVSWLVLLLLLPWASLLRRRWRALANHRRRHASLRPLSRPAALQFKFSWQVGFRLSLSLSAYGTPTLHEHSHPRTRTPATSTSQRVIGDGLPSCYERCSDGVEVTKELKKRSWGVRQESLVSSVVVAVSRAIERLSFQRVQLSAAAGRAVLSRSGLPLPEQ